MFIFAEGTTDYDPLNAESAVDLHAFGIKNVIFAAFFDPFSSIIRLIHHSGKSVQEYIAQGIKVTLAKGASPKSATVQSTDQKRFAVDIERGEKIVSSVVLKGVLWLAVTKDVREHSTVQVLI